MAKESKHFKKFFFNYQTLKIRKNLPSEERPAFFLLMKVKVCSLLVMAPFFP